MHGQALPDIDLKLVVESHDVQFVVRTEQVAHLTSHGSQFDMPEFHIDVVEH